MNRALQKFALFSAYDKIYEVHVGAEQSALCGPSARRLLLLVCQGCVCSSSNWPILNERHRIMTKPVYTICEQQRRRSVCAATQSDRFLCYFTPKNAIPAVSIANISRLLLVCITKLVGQGLVLPDRTTRKTGFLVTWLKWAATWQNQQSDCAPSEDSDQPGRPPSLIRVFAVPMKKAWVLSYPLSAQRRLIRLGGCPGWSEPSLGAQSLCWFWHVAAQIRFRCRGLRIFKYHKIWLSWIEEQILEELLKWVSK